MRTPADTPLRYGKVTVYRNTSAACSRSSCDVDDIRGGHSDSSALKRLELINAVNLQTLIVGIHFETIVIQGVSVEVVHYAAQTVAADMDSVGCDILEILILR